MKKFLLLFCAILLLVSTALPVFAASSVSASLSVSDKTVNAGDKITITVSANVDSCGSGGVEISFDASVFELMSGDWVLKNTFMSDFSTKSKDGVFAFDSATKVSGKVFKFVLKVKSGADLGKSTVKVQFKADKKSVSKTTTITIACAHKYDNKCDVKCNKCGASRKITHTWNEGAVLTAATCAAEGSVKYTCTICKETKTEKTPKAEHSYDNACDTTCNVCNDVREITHTYQWACDTAEHWQECAICGEQMERSAHELQATVTGNEAGHGYACTICALIPSAQTHSFDSSCDTDCKECGYVRSVTHYYSPQYIFDTEQHWRACILCGAKTDEGTHTVNEIATELSDQSCTVCGFITKPSANHVHEKYGDWLIDDTNHWYLCRCGTITDPVEHNWDAGTVNADKGVVTYLCQDCGQFTAEAYIQESEKSTLERVAEELQKLLGDIPLWIVALSLAGVSVVLNVVLIFCVAVCTSKIKKLKNRYNFDSTL